MLTPNEYLKLKEEHRATKHDKLRLDILSALKNKIAESVETKTFSTNFTVYVIKRSTDIKALGGVLKDISKETGWRLTIIRGERVEAYAHNAPQQSVQVYGRT